MKLAGSLLAGMILSTTAILAQDADQDAVNAAAVSLPEGFPGLEPIQIPARPTPPNAAPTVTEIPAPPKVSLPGGGLTWDETVLTVAAAAGQDLVRFNYRFTNQTTEDITITSVRPSCGCTTAEMPGTPWVIPPGTNGAIGLRVNLAGKNGALVKTTGIATDKGEQVLTMKINIAPPDETTPMMSESQRARAMEIAKADRQAVFKGDCAACHNKDLAPKSGKELFVAACAICHEAEHRASMVPDLRQLKTPTNQDFWRQWIAHGKPGSLMPAFHKDEGGPLTAAQIDSLAAWLEQNISSAPTNPPAH